MSYPDELDRRRAEVARALRRMIFVTGVSTLPLLLILYLHFGAQLLPFEAVPVWLVVMFVIDALAALRLMRALKAANDALHAGPRR